MQLQEINREPLQEWFENSCSMWVDYYNLVLNASWNTDADKMWYQEQINMNKLYDV